MYQRDILEDSVKFSCLKHGEAIFCTLVGCVFEVAEVSLQPNKTVKDGHSRVIYCTLCSKLCVTNCAFSKPWSNWGLQSVCVNCTAELILSADRLAVCRFLHPAVTDTPVINTQDNLRFGTVLQLYAIWLTVVHLTHCYLCQHV